MNTIDQKLIQKSQAIFNDPEKGLEKWNALLELSKLDDKIQWHWLAVGTKELRNYINHDLPDCWVCEPWGGDVDTRWYLKDYKPDSLAIGFGWKYELHLHHRANYDRIDSELVTQQLETEKYAELLKRFGLNPAKEAVSEGWASKIIQRCRDFTFGSRNDGNITVRELAWYAANRTDVFVEQAASKIKQFTHDPEMTRLFSELNREAQKTPSNS